MASTLRKVLTVGAAAAAVALAVPAAPALAINTVPCDRDEYTAVTWHSDTGSSWSGPYTTCLANAGEWDMPGGSGINKLWLHKIWTGNNRVQWWGDGRWQPATPIDKWTVYTFPNHPGGVRIDWIRIL